MSLSCFILQIQLELLIKNMLRVYILLSIALQLITFILGISSKKHKIHVKINIPKKYCLNMHRMCTQLMQGYRKILILVV